jgi:hypothetical protein
MLGMKIRREKFAVKANYCFTLLLVLGLIVACPEIVAVGGTEETQRVPLIRSASVPIYPVAARAARIEGKVVLEISTNGHEVSKVEVKNGPPMLASAARENIATWHFEDHKPITFGSIFQYQIVEPASCGYENGTATLKLPTFVEIRVNGLKTCDPAVEIKKGSKKQ